MSTIHYYQLCKKVTNGVHEIGPKTLMSICKIESNFDPYAVRFEPHWKYHWKVKEFASDNRITQDTERVLQATSWGLTQVMGTVARELGHKGPLTALVDEELNLTLCVQKLARLWAKYGDLGDVVSSYNQGSPRKNEDGEYRNQAYVDKFYKYFESWSF